ncbi:MAG: tripartite tricarboxylate transporter substrate binding protein [Alphaproteobacteria bacterium]|nr:tripartite tricarboxylate transporter substrate binding protein [Alphaproteobacteria bacterium]
MTTRRRSFLVAGAAASFGLSGAARAAWPDKPIRFVVSFAPGTATDNLARVLAESIAADLSQPIVIDNKPGAQGSIGANQVAKAPADGYTILVGSATTQAAAASLLKTIPYDPVRDFAPITKLGHIAQVLVVPAESPHRDVAALVAHARAHPGKVNYGTGSSGNLLPSATLVKRLGLDIARVTYRSPPQAMADVLGGSVQFMFIDVSAALGQIRAGKLRALAVSSAQPSALLPGVPSIAATLPGFELLTWFAMYAPSGTDGAIVARLNASARKALADTAIASRLADMGFEVYGSTPDELRAFTAAEVAKWRTLVAETGIEPE